MFIPQLVNVTWKPFCKVARLHLTNSLNIKYFCSMLTVLYISSTYWWHISEWSHCEWTFINQWSILLENVTVQQKPLAVIFTPLPPGRDTKLFFIKPNTCSGFCVWGVKLLLQRNICCSLQISAQHVSPFKKSQTFSPASFCHRGTIQAKCVLCKILICLWGPRSSNRSTEKLFSALWRWVWNSLFGWRRRIRVEMDVK